MKDETLNANTLGNAAHHDLQFRIPRQPIVRKGIVFKEVDDGIKLLGAPTDKLFKGQFAKNQLMRLVNLCDGTRTHEQIADALELPAEAIFRAISLMWTSGAIEEGDNNHLKNHLLPETITLFSRLGDSTGINESWLDAVDKLSNLRILIVGDNLFADSILLELSKLIDNVDKNMETPTHVIVSTLDSRAEDRELDEILWESKIPVIYTDLTKTTLTIGPYVDPTFTPCSQCARTYQNNRTNNGYFRDINFAAGLVARNLISLFTQVTNSYLPMDIVTINLETLEHSAHTPSTRPGCPICGNATGPVSANAPTAAIYEATVTIPPRAYMDLKGHQLHYKPSNLKLQHDFRTWKNGETLKLPKVGLETLQAAIEVPKNNINETLTLTSLALILKISCGLQEPDSSEKKLRRWTAAGGNIGSVTGYVIITDPSIAPPGAYVYQEHNHSLVKLNDDTSAAPSPHSQATLVLSGNVNKVAKKYYAFALRITLQDSGCSLTSAQLVAENLHIYTKIETDWNDLALSETCSIPINSEIIAAVMSIGDYNAL